MNIQRIIGTAFLVCGLIYAFFIGRDIYRRKDEYKKEPGDIKVLAALEFFIYFVCTLGVSDFLLNTLLIKKFRLADSKGLPGCLIASTIVPGAFIAFTYLKVDNPVDALTLVLWMVCLSAGAIAGGRAVNSLNGEQLRKIMGIALICSMVALIVKIIVSRGAASDATGFTGIRLVIMCVCCLGIGFINMMGVPCKPAATALLLLLGLSPIATLTLTLVLGSIIPMSGGAAIIKESNYSKKQALASMTAGSVASILGCIMAISLNPTLLNVLLLGVMLIAIISTFKK